MKKKTVFTILQILVTVGILAWVFRDLDRDRKIWNDLLNANLLWFLAGVASYGIVELIGAARWQLLLRVQGIDIPFLRLGSLLMIGIWFNQFMPGGTGGDVVKVYYLLKETPNKKTQALLAVLMDRLIGLIGLIFVGAAVIIWKWDWLTQGKQIPPFEFANMRNWLSKIPATTQLLYFLLAILCATLLGIVVSFAITGLGLARKLPARFPGRDIFVDLSIAYNLYARAWKATLVSILLSFCVHIFSFLLFYSAARSLGIVVPIFDFFSIMPIINTLAALPISVGGTGMREWLFQTMLTTLCINVPADAAVSVSLLGWSMVFFWGLVGLVIYLRYRPTDHAKLSDIEREIGGLGHDIAEGK